MSGTVDNRVVTMTFNNAEFQRRIEETIKSIEKLEKSLDMKNAGKGFENINAKAGKVDTSRMQKGFADVATNVKSVGDAADKLDFSTAKKGIADLSAGAQNVKMEGIGNALDGVSAKFLALSAVGISVLSGLAGKAIETAATFAKQFTLDPVTSGFGEFELKLGSIQTIMAGSGEDLGTVNKKLQELNTYSDKTIYSFADMTSNIGKFTNAGVSLDESVASIQGISNVAALSGANAEEASRAMYNFAQSLSSGSVKLMDWKSIELANMGTVEFKQQLIDSAVAMGTLTKAGDKYKDKAGNVITATKGFNESLSSGWLSSKALTETLGEYSDETTEIGKRATAAAQDVKTFSQMMDTLKESAGSGWATTSELIFGDFNEAKGLFTQLNKGLGGVIGRQADARNKMLADWKAFGGRTFALLGLKNVIDGVMSVFKPIQLAFRSMFPKKTAQDLLKITNAFFQFSKALTINGKTQVKVFQVFKGIFSVFKLGFSVIKGIIGVFATLFKTIAGGAGGGALTVLSAIGGGFSAFVEAFTKDGGGLEIIFAKISSVIVGFAKTVGNVVGAVSGFLGKIFGGEGDEDPKKKGKDTESALAGITEHLAIFGVAAEKVAEIWDGFLEGVKGIGSFFAAIGSAIAKFASGVGGALGDVLAAPNFDKLIKAVQVGLLFKLLSLLKNFGKNFGKIELGGDVMNKIGGMFEELGGVLKSFALQVKAEALKKIAISLAILAASILVLSMIDSKKLTVALGAMVASLGTLLGVMTAMDKLGLDENAVDITLLALSFVLMAASILILSVAVKILSTMDFWAMIQGMAGVVGMMVSLALVSKIMGSMKAGMIKTALGLIGLSIAIVILSFAVNRLAAINPAKMILGLGSMAIGLAMVGTAMKQLPEDAAKRGAGFALLVWGLKELADVVKIFGTMPWAQLAVGLGSVALLLSLIVETMDQMPPNMPMLAAGLLAVAGSIWVISDAVQMLGSMGLWELAKGLGAIAIMMTILVVGMKAMETAEGGALALLVVAGALMVLGTVLATIGGMSIGSIITALLGLALFIGVLAAISVAVQVVVGPMLVLAGVLEAFGIAFLIFGLGAFLAAKAIEVFAESGVKGVKAFATILDDLIKVMPKMGALLTAFLVSMLEGVLDTIPQIVDIVVGLLGKILASLVELAPKIFETLGVFMQGLIDLILEFTPKLVEAGMTIMMSFINGIVQRMPMIGLAAAQIIAGLLNGIAAGIGGIVNAAVNLITSFLGALAARAPDLVFAGLGLLIALIKGLADNVGLLVASITALIVALITELGNSADDMIKAGTELITKLMVGIGNSMMAILITGVAVAMKLMEGLSGATTELIKGAFDTLVAFLDELAIIIDDESERIGRAMGKLAKALIKGLIKGLNAAVDELGLKDVVAGIANTVTDKLGLDWKINSPSLVMAELGHGLIEGLVMGLEDDRALEVASANVATKALNSFAESLTTFEDLGDINPTIAPVMDLSNIEKGAQEMGALINGSTLTPTVSLDAARQIATTEAERRDSETAPTTESTVINFEQNIHSPKALSTADIYRQTKGQIALAKEELQIA